jgi:hypothetical protein
MEALVFSKNFGRWRGKIDCAFGAGIDIAAAM